MQGAPTKAWAKLRQDPDGRVLSWHPLEAHAADVAACTEALLTHTLLGLRLARLAGLQAFEPVQLQRLCALAAFHDLGKANVGFQNRAAPGLEPRAGHVGPQIALLNLSLCLPATQKLRVATGLDDILNFWGESFEMGMDLLLAALAHHGRPIQPGAAGSYQDVLWRPKDGHDPFAVQAALAQAVRRWFPLAFESGGPPFPDKPALAHGFTGLVTLADWLASDSRPDFFPFAEEVDGERFPWARSRALHVLGEMGMRVDAARSALGRPSFEKLLPQGVVPHDVQRTVMDLPASPGGSLVILEAETGAGKTEAALARFLVLFAAGEVDGLYFALPTRTSATQLYGRLVKMRDLAFPAPQRPPVILAVPGYLSCDGIEGQRLAPFEVLWPDDDARRHRAWAGEQPKRYLAGAIAVGTIDQALLAALQVRHSHLRGCSLLRQFLVIDEVHASDTYMNRITESLLDRHLSAGGHALLMSATLGVSARARFLERRRPRRQGLALPDPQEAAALPFPSILHCTGNDPPRLHVPASEAPPKRVRLDLQPLMAEPSQVAARALDAAVCGARVLVLRNTVADCLATQEALESLAEARAWGHFLFRCQGRVAPHHARFAGPDRKLLDIALEEDFGKFRPAGGKVAVATQTVQQSLDLDADLMISDLCPMDVLLQRVGRMHRHVRVRPPGFEQAALQVLVPSERDLGSLIHGDRAFGRHGLGTVYEDPRVLEATWRLLESRDTLEIPSDNRRLVELATHPQVLEEISRELGPRWERLEQGVIGRRITHAQLANLNFEDWKESLYAGKPSGSSPEAELKIQTRLGEGERLLRLRQAVVSPFGASIQQVTLPSWWKLGEVPNELDVKQADPLVMEFGKVKMEYSRLGLIVRGEAP